MALTDLKDKDELEQEQPDHAAPLRADVLGSIAGADPRDPGYLGKINHLITAHGALETMNAPPSQPMAPANRMAGPGEPPTMGQPSAPESTGFTGMGQPAKPQPSILGKIGHVASKMGNVAGDIFAPGVMMNIPGTDLNKRVEAMRAERTKERQQALDTQQEAVEQRPGIAEAAGETKGKLEAQKEAAAAELAKGKEGSAEKIAAGKEGSSEAIAAGKEGSAERIATGKGQTAEDIAKERVASQERIAMGHNLATTESARIRASSANDPTKLTNTMKTMKQQAQSTLPGIDRALDETEKVAGLLGPTAGRWNDFWQGKVGSGDPKYAHYKDEIGLVSSAVTLAHARGRMSNELFEHFEKMFDAGKQSPENMIQALNVAKEWLTDYAKMGDAPQQQGGGGKEIHYKVVNGKLVPQ